MKDTWDVMKIAKLGRYKFGDGLDEIEIAYALDKLGFNITYCSGYSRNQLLEYIKNPIKFLEKNTKEKYRKYIKDGKRIDGNGGTTFDLSDTAILQKVLNDTDINKIYKADIVKTIQKNQNENTLFVLGVNRYILFNKKEKKGESGGHVVLCKGIKNGKCEIYDPGPEKKPIFIKTDSVVKSMNETGSYVFIIIKKSP